MHIVASTPRDSNLIHKVYKVELEGTSSSDNISKYLGNTNGMWVIEHEFPTKGGKVEWD